MIHYVFIERKLKGCLRNVSMLRGVIGDRRFHHNFVDVKVNVGRRWRVGEGERQ